MEEPHRVILRGETESVLTIKTPFGSEETIARTDIVALNRSGVSLMPDGLENATGKEGLGDLLEYLKTGSVTREQHRPL